MEGLAVLFWRAVVDEREMCDRNFNICANL